MTTSRILRGGSWAGDARFVCCADRNAGDPGYRLGNFGFRPVAEAILPHILRGGSWLDMPKHSRCAVRFSSGPGLFKHFEHFGFRPVAKAQ
jgi:formylglycine-generating enzyme required for sulfatase activity